MSEKISVLSDCPTVPSEEFIAIDDDDVCAASIMADRHFWSLVKAQKISLMEYWNVACLVTTLNFKYDQARRRFVEWVQNQIAVVPDFHKRNLFSDEAHFWLNGYVNKQNCRIWSEANPQVYVETPLHPEKLTVWCALWAGGILLQKR
ncbi:hypothetical protein TNCV_354201 [Trichonephila clavipes]|uniref:Uncharacterized protein n=1 Tax=Trichonephila clavipes TaxID=2585209 RepID=A0A8X7BBY1_TRICX|nr:hypothetical protein TNCV_354201 [Trichonephila clavipes]